MPDPWQAPEAGLPDTRSAAPPVVPGALDPMEVPRRVWADLTANPVGFFLAGLGYFVAVLVLIVVAIGALGVCMAPGIVTEDETLMVLGGIVGMTIYTVSILAFSFVGFPLMTASLLRGLANQHAGEGTVGIGSLVDRATERAGPVIGFYLLSQLAVFVGIFMCYVPGLIAAVISSFALPIVVFEDVGPVEAFKRGFDHMRREPTWHVATWLLLFCALIAAELTIVGLLFMFPIVAAWQYHAWQLAFPDREG